MSDVKKYVASWLHNAKFYSLDDVDDAWANPDWARMMINECPLPPSKKIIDAIAEAAIKGNRYPGSKLELRKKIADLHGLTPEQVILGNGSSELIDAMMRVFVTPGDEVIISEPTFSMYQVRVTVAGGKAVAVPMTPELEYDTDAILKAVTDRTKVIIVCNPNNPTGNFIPDEDLLRIVNTGVPIFLDEAYLEFYPDKGSKSYLIKDHPNVLCSHTFSKAFGLAGVRFGYMLGAKEIIDIFQKVVITWNNNFMTLAAVEALLDNPDEAALKRDFNNKYVRFFVDELSKIPGVRPYFSHGNYVLVDATDAGFESKQIVNAALKEKFQIKPMGALHGRKGFFRITIGTADENEHLMAFLSKFLRK
ncbi:MAG: histidinol-phosphate transaminase [bacterium]